MPASTSARAYAGIPACHGMLDMTVYGRQEPWEDSPEGWPCPRAAPRSPNDSALAASRNTAHPVYQGPGWLLATMTGDRVRAIIGSAARI
jgi:hypothetical protein